MIRTATRADVPALARLITLAYRVEDFFIDGDRTNVEEILDLFGRGEFLILEDPPGTLAGCVYAEFRGNRGYFGMLSIDPARQGLGLGGQLIDHVEERCRAAGCRHIDIEVVNIREELPPFYRRLGYVERGTAPFPAMARAKRPCHFIVMTKELGQKVC